VELREYDSPSEPDEQEEKKEQTTKTAEESEMRGVHALTSIPTNTICMSVPRRCLITVEMGQETAIGQAILRSDLDLDAPKHIYLMVYLLWDRKLNGSRSFFHPYYEILPQTLRNMPIFWTQEELDGLKGSYLLQQIEDRNDAIAEDYHAICQIAPLAQICTLDEFKWARMCVCSRNFGLQIDGHRTSALVPHADMLNHYRPRETKWTFDEDRQAFTITTYVPLVFLTLLLLLVVVNGRRYVFHIRLTVDSMVLPKISRLQPIPAGAQVYDSYGQKCNHRFLLNYGFAVEDNREIDGFCPNEVPIELTLSQDDPLFLQKVDFWLRGEVNATKSNTKRVRVCVANNDNTRLLFSLLRAMNCDEDELRAITTPGTCDVRGLFGHEHRGALASYYGSSSDIRHPISLRNERAAMTMVTEVISTALAQYPTSLARDKADLMDERLYPRFSNKRHAKIQVRGEKEVLHHYARWARTAIDVLDVIERELREEQQRGVEVQLGLGVVSDDAPRRCEYDHIVRRMEEEETGVHHTIVRYCADVLGSLRREELKNLRRQRVVPISAGARRPENYP
jgi:histone-lysine N-methyltransferase SETD3